MSEKSELNGAVENGRNESKIATLPKQIAEGEPLLEETRKEKARLRLKQALAIGGPFIITLGVGMTSGFSAVLLPQLMSNETTIQITQDQSSWIASLAVPPMAVGCILSGYLMEEFGRRLIQMFTSMLFVIAWVIVSVSTSVEVLYVGRIVSGLSAGLLSPLCLVYIAEVSDPVIRGTFLASIPLAISTGVLVSHSLGTFLNWKLSAAICAVFPLVSYIFYYFAPESPLWLANKGYTKKAEETFRYLRGYSKSSSDELHILLNRTTKAKDKSSEINKETVKRILSPTFLKPLITMLVLFFIQQFSGINAVIYYSVDILKSTTSNVNEYLATIIVDILRVIMSVTMCFVMKKYNRRSLALFSTIATGISLLLFSLAFRFLPQNYSWVNFVIISLYICCVYSGLVQIPWILTGEIFPTTMREIGSGGCTCFAFLMFFTVVKTGPVMFSEIGTGNGFLVYAVIALAGSVFIYFFLPETKNMTLQKIGDGYKDDNDNKTVTKV
ncbi:facilitated trehalose transporter Tret1-like isoform X2 [Nilaparvata lugens]|nr:facilitated trehalose transporter Tret1 isoform X2 [Nilaparvata lugens]XP_039275786.1 facilitated trehalose transporter Tret1 isoform X2 [Nilaparvata lugens]XP_039275787.1 facilitated trehalose transporter Tret1 isoform X2 [Nilaparvata lugens]XP_039299274.1 facilitated trehalose transporter Tret1-like isoform X2 [Nilaparvata lugens]XP_039299278.1 facilitated trehalose transporter Tret1-like isoform X2 [Nilaparvata lugens]XP_039299285.1 facilitated trehalose transporter Tret1-like isoform X2